MASWLSFWNRETLRRQRAQGPDDTPGVADIWVAWGRGKIGRGDTIYCVGIEAGELLLYGRVVAERIAISDESNDTIDVWGEPRHTVFTGELPVPRASVDTITYLKSDGTSEGFKRKNGALDGTRFQGRASVRELVAGTDALNKLANA